MGQRDSGVAACCAAEALGTFILVFLGCGAVHTAVTTGALSGSWQVAIVWGIAVCLAAFLAGGVSGAHINPAITLCLALWQGFPRSRILPYWLAQLAGAALAALALYLIFADTIAAYEIKQGITRGLAGSEVTAALYGEYFPNPTVAIHGAGAGAAHGNLGVLAAMLAEILATGILAAVVLGAGDLQNPGRAPERTAPIIVGLTVAALVAIFGPMTQACFNPARDFGPRMVAWFAGWGDIAFPGPRGAAATLLVYLAAPLIGAVLGGWLYVTALRPLYQRSGGDL